MTSKSVYQAIEIESHQPVSQARNSIQFARSDARRHFERTGNHCGVCQIQIVWDTSQIEDPVTA